MNLKRGELFKFNKNRPSHRSIYGIAAAFGMSFAMPGSVSAAGTWGTSATQVKVGTLPLLAALGIGIVVAVGAAIAFLQMTAKGRDHNGNASSVSGEEQEYFEEPNGEDWNDEDASASEMSDDATITDYTIPVTQVLKFPDQAEPAEGHEPRLCGLEGEHAGNCYRVLNRRLTFGRDPSRCAILFPYEAGEISRIHCTLRYIEEYRLFILEDNGSSNGTFLSNGERLKPGVRYELRSGESFSLSGRQQCFEVKDDEQRVV